MASGIPATLVASHDEVMVPLPSCPEELWPQQLMVPSVCAAHVCWWALVTVAASAMFVTGTGVNALKVAPLPSCP